MLGDTRVVDDLKRVGGVKQYFMYNFCTYFDKNYMSRGLVLYYSLKANCPQFRLWVLCMDNESYAVLDDLHLSEVVLIKLEDFERNDVALNAAKNDRTKMEYYFTCTPSLPLFVFRHFSEVNVITYLDADLCFFSDLAPLYEEIGDRSVAIIGHRFSLENRSMDVHGKFNVGWLTFRRDYDGIACLKWWRARCNEWCHDRLEDGRYGDQKYLDDWPQRFNNVVVLQHKGANVAPWNVANYNVWTNGATVFVDDVPLVFFHFHGLRQVISRLHDTGAYVYRFNLTSTIRNYVYRPYLDLVMSANVTIESKMGLRPRCNGVRAKDTLKRFRSLLYVIVHSGSYIAASKRGLVLMH